MDNWYFLLKRARMLLTMHYLKTLDSPAVPKADSPAVAKVGSSGLDDGGDLPLHAVYVCCRKRVIE